MHPLSSPRARVTLLATAGVVLAASGWAFGAVGAGVPSTVISGTVTLASGQTPEWASVTAYVPSESPYYDGYEPITSDYFGGTDTTYRLKIPTSAGAVRLEFAAENGAIAYYDEPAASDLTNTLAAASDVDVSSGGSLSIGVSLPAGGTVRGALPDFVSGAVVDAGSGAASTYTYADFDVVEGERFSYGSAYPVLAGTYTLEFGRDSEFTPYIDQYLGSVPAEDGVGAADTFTVVDGADTTQDVASLLRGGVITGRLVDSGGRPIIGCFVRAVDPTGDLPTRLSTASDVKGRFRIPGLSEQPYLLAVNGGGSCAGVETWASGHALQRARAGASTIAATPGTPVDVGTLKHFTTYRATRFYDRPHLQPANERVRPGTDLYIYPGLVRFGSRIIGFGAGTIQMLRDGKPFGPAHNMMRFYSYTVTRADRGHTLSFKLTGSPRGARPISAVSTKLRVP
mgnify:CR=1 FL=1